MAIIVNFLERHKTTGKVVGYVLSGILFFVFLLAVIVIFGLILYLLGLIPPPP